ncbi:hypothetical protein GOP47_0013155 [Adiantum capillus-veneris]|uniref:Transmembrane protein n=1 Tax=Adiantum capillus-veneris TaxID=13818 RepID=A0A9D4UNK2_ADICA|nr:hypothetical protein GOP47_0013155 [Adiantum capillus-veneris]
MANMMEKIGDKLHMGGHRKEEPHTVGAAHAPHYAASPGYGATWQSLRASQKQSKKAEAEKRIEVLLLKLLAMFAVFVVTSLQLVFHKSNSVTNF